MDESSPRSARMKKKSHLARLVAKKKGSDDSASDMGSRSSLNEVHPEKPSQHPIDANILVQNRENRYGRSNNGDNEDDSEEDDDDDSDEGISVNNKGKGRSYGYTRNKRIPSDGTLNRFQSMRVNGQDYSESEEDDDEEEDDIESPFTGKRDREQNSDGDDLRRDSGNFKAKRPSFSHDSASDENKPHTSKHRQNIESDESSEIDSDDHLPDRNSSLNQTYKKDSDQEAIRDQYRKLLSTQQETDSPKLTKRKSPLSMRKSELDPVEENEVSDELSELSKKFHPRPSAFSPTPGQSTSNTDSFGLDSRPWSAANVTDAMSGESMQSSSALPLISTKEARNRSFLVGSMNSNGSLLGTDELERFFPDRKMRVFVGTWNMCEMKNVPSSLNDFMLPDNCDFVCDMYVIGTQESTPNRKEWEIKLQETLGPQHVLYHSSAHGCLYLSIFIRRDLIWFCSVPEESNVSTRTFSAFKTKGGQGISLTIFGTSLLFVNCHLSPHDGKMKERIGDFNKINANLKLPQEVNANSYTGNTDDVSSRFDCVLWCGDTNFRITKERSHIEDAMRGIETQEIKDFQDLVQHDELFLARTQGLAFQDFQEGRIKFRPSYKYDIGTDNIDTSKKMRIPSYTDRILFRCKKKHAMTCIHYDSSFDVKESDHKPVFGVYEVTLRPGRDNIPLSAGQFNRDVWLEANKRRAHARNAGCKTKDPKSSVCSLQ